LTFAFDTLRVGGHFVAKFYDGAESKQLERQLRKLFGAVHREKPESSRSVSVTGTTATRANFVQESKEAYFVALRRKNDVSMEEIINPD
jgi:21S rRNA (uridine2791-2'-O)-methyltransferase